MPLRQKLTALKRPAFAFAGGLLLGILAVLAIRFVSYAPEHTHYHANFAVYLNGERELFKDPRYYQEVAICGNGDSIPEARVHLHDADNAVIHVHDKAVTWGQFFNNIGWTIGSDFIATDTKLYQEDDINKLHIYINEQDYTGLTTLTNTVIKDKDRVLISFGSQDDATLLKEAKAVSKSAAKYDAAQDPASCAGHDKPTAKERLKHLF